MVSKQEAFLEDSLNTPSMPGGLEDRIGLPGSFAPVLDEILAEEGGMEQEKEQEQERPGGGQEQEKERPAGGLELEEEKERPVGGLEQEQEKKRPAGGLKQEKEQEQERPVSLTQKLRAFRRRPQDRKKPSSLRPRAIVELGQAGSDLDIKPDACSTQETWPALEVDPFSLPPDYLTHILKTRDPAQVEQRTELLNPQDHKPAVLSCEDETSDCKVRDQPEASLKQETCLIEDIRPASLPLDTLTKILDAIKEREEQHEDQKPEDAKPANPKLDDVNPEVAPARWATIIPLIGGSAIGCEQATGSKPVVHLTYSEVILPPDTLLYSLTCS